MTLESPGKSSQLQVWGSLRIHMSLPKWWKLRKSEPQEILDNSRGTSVQHTLGTQQELAETEENLESAKDCYHIHREAGGSVGFGGYRSEEEPPSFCVKLEERWETEGEGKAEASWEVSGWCRVGKGRMVSGVLFISYQSFQASSSLEWCCSSPPPLLGNHRTVVLLMEGWGWGVRTIHLPPFKSFPRPSHYGSEFMRNMPPPSFKKFHRIPISGCPTLLFSPSSLQEKLFKGGDL